MAPWVAVWRTGTPEAHAWHRSAAFSTWDEARAAADRTEALGLPSLVERADLSESIGLPETYVPTPVLQRRRGQR